LPLQLALLAFALGVVVLQAQPSLPDSHLALCVPLFALLWCLLAGRTRYAVAVLALAAGTCGFFYAAWRAEIRRLPRCLPRRVAMSALSADRPVAAIG
jgi:hypothetical protein